MLESALRYLGAYRIYEGRLKAQVQGEEIPGHIGIILDGNRRWAQNQGVSDGLGHAEGANRAEELLDWCHDLGIKTVTLYVLSTENLDRTPEELAALFGLIEARLNRLLSDVRIAKHRVNVRAIGHLDLLPKSIVGLLTAIEEKTSGYSDHYLNIAVAYGGARGDHGRGEVHRPGREERQAQPPGHNRGHGVEEALHCLPPQPGAGPDNQDVRGGEDERVPPLAGRLL